jgi:hypothetical protein
MVFAKKNEEAKAKTTAVEVEDTGMILETIKSSESWSDDPKVRTEGDGANSALTSDMWLSPSPLARAHSLSPLSPLSPL